MSAIIFWSAGMLVVYPYLIYPVLLRLLSRRHSPGQAVGGETEPGVTLIVSAYNEQAVIRNKLRNSRSLDYPADKLEIIVVSDASSDDTDEIVREECALDGRIRLAVQPTRRGKSAGLNEAVELAKGEIVVFSDANAIYDRGALRELVGAFREPVVGYVVGAALYERAHGSEAAENEGLYWRFELWLKRLESACGSVVGGDGAIYAIRRALFRPLRDDDISDFVNPLQIVASGHRGVFNERARCYEQAGESFAKEFRRHRRIVNRSWRAVRRYAGLLNVRQHGRFLFMLLSHKVIRWLALPLILVAWLANCFLLRTSPFYTVTLCLITASFLIAGLGAALEALGGRPPRAVSVLSYFYMANLAGTLGIWDEFRGKRHVTWDHVRKVES